MRQQFSRPSGPARTSRLVPSTVLVTVLAMLAAMLVGAGGPANAQRSTSAGGGLAAAGDSLGAARGPVSSGPRGTLTSRVVGQAANGDAVRGTFTPLHFVRKNGKVKVRGLIDGVVTATDGTTTTFSALRTMRVAAINQTPVRAGGGATGRATCDILHLRLAPLDLDLLGLKIHLDRVVLDIVATTGAGNLLGNLLCAVTGLLDGGLGGLLGRLTNLLNQVLGALRLGV